MQKLVLNNISLDKINEAADQILGFVDDIKIICLIGDLGAGKTTLTKILAQKLGVLDMVSSPTFSIVNEYETKYSDIIYHFDCYRVKNLEEALDFGIEEYLDSNCLCLIEWPEVISDLLPDKLLNIQIDIESEGFRKITLLKFS